MLFTTPNEKVKETNPCLSGPVVPEKKRMIQLIFLQQTNWCLIEEQIFRLTFLFCKGKSEEQTQTLEQARSSSAYEQGSWVLDDLTTRMGE